MHNALLLAAATIVASATQALADITYTIDARSLTASAVTPSGANGPFTSTPTGPVFNDTVSASSNGPSGGFTSASATQNSQLLADRILGTGDGTAVLNLGGGSAGAYSAVGRSTFDVTFQISASSPYSLLANAASGGAGAGVDPNRLLFSLSGPAFASPLEIHGTGGTFNQAGVLTPGTYRLQAYAVHTEGFASGQGGSFDFSLIVPAPASAAIVGLGLLTTIRRRRSAAE